jgi:hypothetical protein
MKKKPSVIPSRSKKRTTTVAASAPLKVEDPEWERFLEDAYLRLLDRPADAFGMGAYRQRLANGETKEQILADLASSAEGQRVALRRRFWQQLYGET